MNDRIGTTLRGYQILGRISTGGFSVVYRAFQPGVAREVAIKVIHPMLANEPAFIRRFETEAQLVARLEHPFIVPIFDFWRDPDGAYLVMRWFPDNLRNLINRRGRIDADLTMRITDQVASALAFAHRHQVVHLDIKPDNILLDADNNAFLSDFGIARVGADFFPREGMVANGAHLISVNDESEDETVGSPAYISPEQLIGSTVTPATDIYQFGVTIFEMLTGAHPFARADANTLIMNHLRDPLPSLTDPLTRVNPVLGRATLKDPTARYDSAMALSRDLRRALGGDHLAPLTTGDTPLDSSIPLNPYKGLRAFEEADSDDFFGRDAMTELLMARLTADEPLNNFLAVVGASGSGKSSAIRAGLFPALRQDIRTRDWFIIDMLPSGRPLDQLSAALLSVSRTPIPDLPERLTRDTRALLNTVNGLLPLLGGDLLLFIDQFEEVYTLVENDAERAQFLTLLETAVRAPGSRLHVVIALRADFYDRPLSDARFGALVQARTQVVLPLNTLEIEQAILRPAARVGLTVEHELVTAIVSDVSEEPGALPLLQYALTELYEHRDVHSINGDASAEAAAEWTSTRSLSVSVYRAMGGVMGALERRSEEVYAALPPSAKAVTREIMLRLVTLGEGVEDTRRRVKRSELAALDAQSVSPTDSDLAIVLELFGKARLLTFDHDADTREPTVEIAHEALIRAWGRLRDWLNMGRADVRMQRTLAALAAEWEASKRDSGFLLLGARLTQFEEWVGANKLNTPANLLSSSTHTGSIALTASERAFLNASIAARVQREEAEGMRRSRELELARDAAEAERRRAEQLRAFVRTLALVGAALMLVTGLAAFFALQASQNAEESDRRADIAQAIALAAQADVELRGSHPERATLLALTALDNYPYTLQAERALMSAVLSNRLRWVWQVTAVINAVAFSPDGRLAAAALQNGSVVIRDLETDTVLTTILSPTDATVVDNGLTGLGFHPDGTILMTAAQDGGVRLWNVETGDLLWEGLHRSVVTGAAISTNGTRIASVSTDGNLRVWALAIDTTGDTPIITGTLTLDINDGRLRSVGAVAFSPTGTQVATTTFDAIRLWDAQTGEQRLTLRHEGGDVNSVAFSPDGRQVVTANADNTVTIWRLGSLDPNAKLTLTAHTAPPRAAIYSQDGTTIASAGDDNTVRVWNALTGGLLYTLAGHDSSVRSVAFNPSGRAILSGSADGTVRMWGNMIGYEGRMFDGHAQLISSVAFSPDGRLAASGGYDRMVHIWDMIMDTERLTLQQEDWVNAIVFTPDSRQIISGGRDGFVSVWDVETGELVRRYEEHTGIIDAIAISPDGRWVASGGSDRVVRVWDAQTGETQFIFSEHTAGVSGIAFSPDGDEIVSSAFDSTVRVWDAETGAVRLTLTGHDGGVTSVDFSPTRQQIVTGGVDRSVRVWDAQTGALITTFLGHTDVVNSVDFSPNGQRVLSASEDSALRLWDVPSRQPMIVYGTIAQSIRDAAFDVHGTSMIAGYRDGSVRVWRTWQDADSLRADARACCVFRDFTDAERQLFGLDSSMQ